MLNSVNCSTVICSPTVEYLCSWEKPLVKSMAPGSILIISIYINLFTCFLFTLPLVFTLLLSIKNTKNIISIRSHSRKWPWRDWQPLSIGCELLSFCVRTRDLCVVSYWIDTLVLKNWGKYLCYFAASSLPLRGKPTQCSRGSKKDFWHRCWGGFHQVKSRFDLPPTCDFWRRCRGGLRSSQDIPSTHHKLISLAFILFAICLSFSSPPLHLCCFICPFFPNLLLSLPFAFFPLPFCLLVCWITCFHGAR